jgi:hypothetical protein
VLRKFGRFTIVGSKAVEERGKTSEECIYGGMRMFTGEINIGFHAVKK